MVFCVLLSSTITEQQMGPVTRTQQLNSRTVSNRLIIKLLLCKFCYFGTYKKSQYCFSIEAIVYEN